MKRGHLYQEKVIQSTFKRRIIMVEFSYLIQDCKEDHRIKPLEISLVIHYTTFCILSDPDMRKLYSNDHIVC